MLLGELNSTVELEGRVIFDQIAALYQGITNRAGAVGAVVGSEAEAAEEGPAPSSLR